ncbi:MAG TPA: hypothetical protein VH540_13990 [Ktedonobacterales bacterium]|jgi:photosystem II stability/assembly factor-like uncharacterized protein
MSKRLPQPCARWAEQLTLADFSQLSDDERAALTAHLNTCPACAAVRDSYLYTAARLRRAPGPAALPGLPPQLLQVWAVEAQRAPARHRDTYGHLQEVTMQTTEYKPAPPAPTPPPTWRRRAGYRAAVMMSAIAAVLAIALVTTALIVSHTSNKPSTTATTPGTSATSAQTPLDQQWQALPNLAKIDSSLKTVLAPSNPRVVYQVSLTLFRRSDDQGATWKNLPTPSGNLIELREVYISPTNQQHVLAITGKACPGSQAAAAGPLARFSGGGESCSTAYFSTNGGEHWAKANVPWTLAAFPNHVSGNFSLVTDIRAQENRLYSILYLNPGASANTVVVESSDDGASWHYADTGHQFEQHCLQTLAVPPTGTTLFATTLNPCNARSASEAQIWRSDDAGAHWTAVGTLSVGSSGGMEAVKVSGQAQPILIDVGNKLQKEMRFSSDNGKTWQPIPALSNQTDGQGQVGVLKDGSLVAQSQDGFFTWKPGFSSWHKIAPAIAGAVIDSLAVSNANGKETLYLEVQPDSDPTFALSYYRIDLP